MFFMRHAQSEFNAVFDKTGADPDMKDPLLTLAGQKQVEEALESLKPYDIKEIISSPYQRAIQTALPVAKMLGLTIKIDPLVGERRLFSCDIGSPKTTLQQNYPDLDFSEIDAGAWWMPFNESQGQVRERAKHFLQKWDEGDAHKNVLVVSHWFFIGSFTGRDVANAQTVEFFPSRFVD